MPAENGNSYNGPCTGKKFLVTGGARGLGKSIVAELHAQGAKVFALGRNPKNLESLKEEFPSVTTICADLSNWEETATALENLENIDGLINNAAVAIPGSLWDLTSEDFDCMFKTNLKSILNVSRIVAKKMIQHGTRGSIVNVSSVAAKRIMPTAIGYGCLKAALEYLTKGMAVEFGPHKITVNSVLPAAIDTDMFSEGTKYAEKEGIDLNSILSALKNKTPTKEFFMPKSDIVNAILFFASGVTSQITGESLLVDGGFKQSL